MAQLPDTNRAKSPYTSSVTRLVSDTTRNRRSPVSLTNRAGGPPNRRTLRTSGRVSACNTSAALRRPKSGIRRSPETKRPVAPGRPPARRARNAARVSGTRLRTLLKGPTHRTCAGAKPTRLRFSEQMRLDDSFLLMVSNAPAKSMHEVGWRCQENQWSGTVRKEANEALAVGAREKIWIAHEIFAQASR